MGRKSIKANKSIYQITRENLDLTREKAADGMDGMSPERLEKIENGRTTIQPEDILLMADCYHSPALCTYYCANECAIGHGRVTEVEEKPLVQISVETLNCINRFSREKDRLLEIAENGQIDPDEQEDFLKIKHMLDQIALSVNTLQLWVDTRIAEGSLKKELFRS